MITDFHTHTLKRNAVVNVDPVDLTDLSRPVFRPGYLYSVGIHPWNLAKVTPESLRLLRALAASPQVVAIGECGLDPLSPIRPHGPIGPHGPMPPISSPLTQQELLRYHISLSESLRKPLILHIVKRFPEIIRLKKELKPTRRWIIHGFRGKPELARELLRHGFTLSFGHRYNPASLALTPPDRLLRETDTMSIPSTPDL